MRTLDEITSEVFAEAGIARSDAKAILDELLQGERLSVLAQTMSIARRLGHDDMQEEIARLVAAACAGPKH